MRAPAPGDAVPPAALVLGYAGVLPFLGCALAMWLLPPAGAAAADLALRGYGAVILSFLGGAHWGLGMAGHGGGGTGPTRLGAAVVPSLVGWVGLLLPAVAGLAWLALAFAGQYAADRAATRRGLAPGWYPRLRLPLTLLVVACLLLGLGAAVRVG